MVWIAVLVLSCATVALVRFEAKIAGRPHDLGYDLWVFFFAFGTYAVWCLLPLVIGAGISRWVAG